jgi:hypothetical protein
LNRLLLGLGVGMLAGCGAREQARQPVKAYRVIPQRAHEHRCRK